MSPTMRIIGLVLIGCLFACGRQDTQSLDASAATEIRIAAAADLKFAMDDAIAAFERLHPNLKVLVSYGSSGNFHAQLRQRAPYDLYFSADIAYPQALIDEGLVEPDSLFVYGIGRVVLWVRDESPLDVETLRMASLGDPRVRRIAMGNPYHAPYGRAGEQALRHSGMNGMVSDRLVLGENIAQAAHFVHSGAADIGILALSLALAPRLAAQGRYWLIPEDHHAPLEQAAVILNWAQHRDAAMAFCRFLREPDGRAIMERYGFVVPAEAAMPTD